MFVLGVVLVVMAILTSTTLIFTHVNFVNRKAIEEEMLGATANYVKVVDQRINEIVSLGLFNEAIFSVIAMPCSLVGQGNCLEVPCSVMKNYFIKNHSQDILGISCQDPFGRSWSIQKIADKYYLYFGLFPEAVVQKMGYENTPEVQRYLASRLAFKIVEGYRLPDYGDLSELEVPGIRHPIKLN